MPCVPVHPRESSITSDSFNPQHVQYACCFQYLHAQKGSMLIALGHVVMTLLFLIYVIKSMHADKKHYETAFQLLLIFVLLVTNFVFLIGLRIENPSLVRFFLGFQTCIIIALFVLFLLLILGVRVFDRPKDGEDTKITIEQELKIMVQIFTALGAVFVEVWFLTVFLKSYRYLNDKYQFMGMNLIVEVWINLSMNTVLFYIIARHIALVCACLRSTPTESFTTTTSTTVPPITQKKSAIPGGTIKLRIKGAKTTDPAAPYPYYYEDVEYDYYYYYYYDEDYYEETGTEPDCKTCSADLVSIPSGGPGGVPFSGDSIDSDNCLKRTFICSGPNAQIEFNGNQGVLRADSPGASVTLVLHCSRDGTFWYYAVAPTIHIDSIECLNA